jgi:group I intron endonuclease
LKSLGAPIVCVYSITNTTNSKCYIGSTKHFQRRKQYHLYNLRKGNHHSCVLQNAWNKYGEASFVFAVIEQMASVDDLSTREQYYLDTLKPEYNISLSAYRIKLTPEALARRNAANRGRKMTPEQAARNRARLMGHPVSETTRAKLAAANTGKKQTDEYKQNMSERLKGRVFSPEHRKNLAESMKTRPLTEGLRAAQKAATDAAAKANLGRKHNPATIAKMKASWEKRRQMKALQSASPDEQQTPSD